MQKKTTLTEKDVATFLREHFTYEIKSALPMVEGEESQAFSFERGGTGYVIRINKSIAGFQKDAYAYHHFHSERIPIPRVIQIGYIDEQHAFCITEHMPGITLQDVDSETIQHLLQPASDVWLALSDCDISQTTGFGDFDANGKGMYATWREYLLSTLNTSSYDWDYASRYVDQLQIKDLTAIFISLVKYCPEERHLIHGDFGANNALTDGRRITAVLDWDCAKYGDLLFDIATAYFWSTWLNCMAVQTAYYERQFSNMPHYRERLLCYQLHIGLTETYDNILYQNWEMAQWAAKRCADIASISPPHTSSPS